VTSTDELLPSDMADIVLCYLSCPNIGNKGALGAVMLTDYRVRPTHFSCVSPVKTSKLQKILYGSILEEHITIDIISNRLLEELPTQPHVILVDDKNLLPIKKITNIPTAFVYGNDESDTDDSVQRIIHETGDDDGEIFTQLFDRLGN